SPPETYPRSLHDALPICGFRTRYQRRLTDAQQIAGRLSELGGVQQIQRLAAGLDRCTQRMDARQQAGEVEARSTQLAGVEVILRSEEHTSELQSRENLVC